MTKLSDADSGRSVVVRWRMLAERRLKYLIELYESGRWTRYYNEPEFLKIVREAHAALKAWENLAPPETVGDMPVEVEAVRPADPPSVERPPVERPAFEWRLASAQSVMASAPTVTPRPTIPPLTTPPLTAPPLATPSLAMRALQTSAYGIGAQYDLGKP